MIETLFETPLEKWIRSLGVTTLHLATVLRADNAACRYLINWT